MQIIVVDGGSTDNTVALAKENSDEVIVSGKGRAAQMNSGAALALGDVLWFLHADTGFNEPIDHYIGLLEGAVWGFFGVRLSSDKWYFRIIGKMISLRSRLQCIGTGDQGLFVRRELFEQISGFESIPLMEDIALCKRLRKMTVPTVASFALITSSRRWQQYGVIKTVLLMWSLRFLYFVGVSPEKLAKRYYS